MRVSLALSVPVCGRSRSGFPGESWLTSVVGGQSAGRVDVYFWLDFFFMAWRGECMEYSVKILT